MKRSAWFVAMWLLGCGARPAEVSLPPGPRLEAWSRRTDGQRLWPGAFKSAQVILSVARPGQLYAFGVADGERVVWAYLLPTAQLGELFEASFGEVKATSSLGGRFLGWIGYGGAGSVSKLPPGDPPLPIGDELRRDIVRALLDGARGMARAGDSLETELPRPAVESTGEGP